MKKTLLKGMVIAGLALTAVLTISLTSVNAASVYDEYSTTTSAVVDPNTTYTVEEMLTYAIQDEYMAQAEYQAIIDTFGEIRPFSKIVLAEQTHIDLLLPLFDAYGVSVPENTAANNVVIPESITSALATGVEAEQANILMYQTFLAQDNVPDDVKTVFQTLISASQHHLTAFSADRYSYLGSDMANQIKNQFRKMFAGQGETRGYGQGYGAGQGSQQRGNNAQGGFGGYAGDCPNA